MSRLGCLPTDPRFIELSRNDTLAQWTAHWLRKREDDWFEALARLLGTMWRRQDLETLGEKKSSVVPDDVFIPLAVGCNPNLIEQLKQLFKIMDSDNQMIGGGEYHQDPNEKIVELGDLSKADFVSWAQQAGQQLRDQTQARQSDPLTISEGAGGDPRLERIREQIAASKRFR